MIGRDFASAERPKHPQSHPERGPTRNMREQSALAHFYPQHWLLCHTGLYEFEFEFPRFEGIAPYFPPSEGIRAHMILR